MKSIMLDTNAYTALMRGDQQIYQYLCSADSVYINAIVLGELYYGFKNGKKENENRAQLSGFLAKPTVKISLPTQDTAEIFADIKLGLKKAGTPVPVNDIWIAALAREAGAWLITYDKHFSHVPGLLLKS